MPDARPARRLLFAAALFLLAGASPARGAGATARHPFTLFTAAERREPMRVSGGLTVVPDHTLRVVERYLGREVAQGTADFMEYQGEGWKQSPGLPLPLPMPAAAPVPSSGPVRPGPARP